MLNAPFSNPFLAVVFGSYEVLIFHIYLSFIWVFFDSYFLQNYFCKKLNVQKVYKNDNIKI